MSREEDVLAVRPNIITTSLYVSKLSGADIIGILEAWPIREVK
jgi:hypothetical protein